jgi:hypothetical protein
VATESRKRLGRSDVARKFIPEISSCDRECTIADGLHVGTTNQQFGGGGRAKTSTRGNVGKRNQVGV